MTERLPAPILLAEDTSDDVLLLRRAFQRTALDWPVEVVPDGEAVIAYLAGSGPYADRERYPLPALLLLDLKLPRRPGLEVLTWVRRQPGLRRLPVVVFTSSRDPADITRAYDLGANSYLVKPGGADELAGLVRALSHYWLNLSERPTLTDTTAGSG